MRLFDRFKKQNKNGVKVEPKVQIPEPRNKDEIQYSYTEDGRLVVELIERFPKDEQFYDTTKLVLDNRMVDLKGYYLQNCMVSWYGQSDCVGLDSRGNEIGRKNQFRNVLADIDTNKLWNDEGYCLSVMKKLLNQNRVTEYLDRGLQENPDLPCGKYVGGIKQRGYEYEKVFYRELGQASHNSPEMITKRQRLQEQRRLRQEQIRADKKAQIAALQQELDEMDR